MSPIETHDLTHPCWTTIGAQGDRSCPELKTHILCRNCPTYRRVGRTLFDRPIPEDYRQEITGWLAERPVPPGGETLRLLVFRVAQLWLALPSKLFELSSQMVEIAPVPGRNKPHFLGLTNIHGEIRLCFSLASLFEGREDPDSDPNEGQAHAFPRLLELKTSEGRWMFPVDEVFQALDWPIDQLEQPPAHLRKENQGLIRAIFTDAGRLIHVLDEGRLTAIWGGSLS